jgi:hypothetical protein
MHPELVTAIAATQRQDKLARAAQARRATAARNGAQPAPGPRHPARHPHLHRPAGLRRLAVPRAK